MASFINHAGIVIPGTTHRTTPGPPELQAKVVQHWGLVGALELRGKRKERTIEVVHTVHNGFPSFAKLEVALHLMDANVGLHGRLRITNSSNGVSWNFNDCTFLGFTPGGADTDGPLPDVAGTLDVVGGWWITGTLRFRQLLIKP